VKRPRRRMLQENLVKTAVDVFENVDAEHGRTRHLKRLSIHKQVNNKYHKMFIKLIDYLEELRGNYKNPIDELLKDYFTTIYDEYSFRKRIPTLINFSPSANNKIKFEEYIYKFSAEYHEEYWIQELTPAPEIIKLPIIPENFNFSPIFAEV